MLSMLVKINFAAVAIFSIIDSGHTLTLTLEFLAAPPHTHVAVTHLLPRSWHGLRESKEGQCKVDKAVLVRLHLFVAGGNLPTK